MCHSTRLAMDGNRLSDLQCFYFTVDETTHKYTGSMGIQLMENKHGFFKNKNKN